MKKILIMILVCGIILGGFFSYKTFFKKENNNNTIIKDNINTDLQPETQKYIDNNPIKLGLYKYYGRNKDRELITEYVTNWNYHKDISSFEVFYTNENYITGYYFQDTFKEYMDKYTNIDNYKIGYKISFITNTKEINKIILSPKDTEEFFDYLEIYLYDDYHIDKGIWYSHTTEEQYNDETLLTSIKLTAGKQITDIISDITVLAFTYDYDDFDNEGNYQGNSQYTITVKNNII